MPRRPSFRSSAIEDLNRQLAFAPQTVQRSRLEAAESLIQSIDAHRMYPMDFVTFKLTGYRPDESVQEHIVGAALRADLVTMIQVASRSCPLAWNGDRGQPLDLDAVATRLGCARRSLRTLRPRGLVFWWTSRSGYPQRLGCPPDMLEWFAGEVQTVAPQWLDEDQRRQIETAASAYMATRSSQATLADVVRHVAATQQLGCDVVRGVLRRAVDAGRVDLPRAKRLQRRDGRLALRAIRHGLPVSSIARRLSISVSSVHRSLQRERLALLVRHLARPCMAIDPTMNFDVPSVPPPRLRWDCTMLLDPLDTSTVIKGVGTSEANLKAIAASMGHLQVLIKAADPRGSIDAWAAIDAGLMELTRRWWGVLLGLRPSIEAGLSGWSGRPVSQMPAAVLRRLLPGLVDVAIATLRRAQVGDAKRLPDRTRSAIDRVLIDPATHVHSGLADTPRGVFLLRHTPWRLLLPDPRWERAIGELSESDAALAMERFGLHGEPLHSATQCAVACGCSVQAIAARTSWLRGQLYRHSAPLHSLRDN